MESVSLTTLRQNIFQIADQVLATGEPVVIERHGQRLVLAPEKPPRLRVEELPRRYAIVGDPEDLVNAPTWNEADWNEPDNLGR
ncbi:MAG: hypothetical protein BSR46_05945 [Candidatus Dactylopiibacterium carminicum]|nr:type II toxin-antitoxin system Phd/YefM family antitoxin [Candidatus Dactylopiibacterium carminicum]PAS99859.1 MAG: hypothetical protein BSR46_05945 [Candidatus Dactylopiibacterium carminicum]